MINICTCTTKCLCYTSQIKYVFKLDENVPHVVGQKLTYSPGRQQLELSDLTWKICLPANIKQTMFSQAVCSILELEVITNHLMTGPTRNSEFLCETKLTVFLGVNHYVLFNQ